MTTDVLIQVTDLQKHFKGGKQNQDEKIRALDGVSEEIHKGEALYEIETDKVVNQIEATEDGILRRQLCEEGDSVAVLTPVAIVET